MVPRKFKGKIVTGADGLSYVTVPCGHCLECKKERSQSWSLRLMLESLGYGCSAFLTLTYDDEHLPLNEYRFPTLQREDLTLFFKRLRRDLEPRRIRYYACGEYGDHTARPHYHAIVYGIDYRERELCEENWPNGFVTLGDVTPASCNYVAGYVQKKLYDNESYDDIEPPYSVMSKHIGADYFNRHCIELLNNNYLLYRGKKFKLPRYFWRMMDKELGTMEKSAIKRIHLDKYLDVLERDYENHGAVDDVSRLQLDEERRLARAMASEKRDEIYERGKI